MDVTFRTRELERCYRNSREAIRKWGYDVGARYVQRITVLQAAPTFGSLFAHTALRLHPLVGDRTGDYALTILGRWRLIISHDESIGQIVVKEVSDHCMADRPTETTSRNIVHSDLPVSPGSVLEEEIMVRGMTQKELARRMGRPPQVINEIIRAKKSITAETALELEKALDMPAQFWLNLESAYRLTLARNREHGRYGSPAD